MEKHNKKYGYTIALWERGKTVPSLFRKVSDWKKARKIRSSPLWTSLIDASYAPWPIRPFLSLLRNRDASGDLWNMCHFLSNFEIADMDFFRSPEYRAFFDFLDAGGGFYFERVSKLFLFRSAVHVARGTLLFIYFDFIRLLFYVRRTRNGRTRGETTRSGERQWPI